MAPPPPAAAGHTAVAPGHSVAGRLRPRRGGRGAWVPVTLNPHSPHAHVLSYGTTFHDSSADFPYPTVRLLHYCPTANPPCIPLSQLLGILGPSGSGKTSLLNVLAGLVTRGSHWDVRGALAVDGHPVGTSLGAARALGAVVGHVPQRDLLCRSLTVRECVVASAALRCGWREARRGRRHLEVGKGWWVLGGYGESSSL